MIHQLLFVMLQEVKISSPDYKDCNSAEAMDDFMKRISCYEASYQPLDPDKCDRCFPELTPSVIHTRA